MKYLGVDYGQKKIGIAVSDDDGNIAFPRDIIINDKINNNHIKYIENICEKDGIKDIVIGKSIDFTGKDNSIESLVSEFINILNKDNKYTVHRIDERFTTSLIASENRFHFQKTQNSKDDDAKVASVILQNFLDSNRKI